MKEAVPSPCPGHLWIMSDDWHRLANVRYVCRRCGAVLPADPTTSAEAEPGNLAWPTWDDISEEP